MSSTSTAYSPAQVRRAIEHCFSKQKPVMLWGPPGIGKSDLMRQIAESQNRNVVDLRLLLMEPTDLRGIPYYNPEKGTMVWAEPEELPKEDGIFSNAILFLDEIVAAPQSIQAAAYQLVLDRKIGSYKLPKDVVVVAAGNRDSDRAATHKMPSPLANRFVHFEMKVGYEDWESWAIKNKIRPEVIGFLKDNQSNLFDFDPRSDDKAFPTPRSWGVVSALLDDDLDDAMIRMLVAGAVGEGTAIAFMAHLEFSHRLPDPMDVLHGKVTSLDVKEVSARFSLVVNLCYCLHEKKEEYENSGVSGKEFEDMRREWNNMANNMIRFVMDNFQDQEELVVMTMKIALREYNLDFDSEVPEFTEFVNKYMTYLRST